MTANKILLVICMILMGATVTSGGGGELLTREGQDGPMLSRVPRNFAPEERNNTEPAPAKGRFLIATPRLKGSVFQESVILLVDHTWHGTTGLIINKPGRATASEVFTNIEELENSREYVYLGGPVELGNIYLLIQAGSRPVESEEVLQNLYFSISLNTLKEVAGSRDPGAKFRLYVGYAGWTTGQLEQEILTGSWYVMEGDQDDVFSDTPSLLWQKFLGKRSRLRDSVLLKQPDNKEVAPL